VNLLLSVTFYWLRETHSYYATAFITTVISFMIQSQRCYTTALTSSHFHVFQLVYNILHGVGQACEVLL